MLVVVDDVAFDVSDVAVAELKSTELSWRRLVMMMKLNRNKMQLRLVDHWGSVDY